MKNYKYILMDLDGTLTDSAEGILNSIYYALTKVGIEIKDKNELQKFIGPPLVPSFMKCYGFSLEKSQYTLDCFRERFSEKGWLENRLYDGIKQLLENLKKCGKILVLATSKPEYFANKIIERFEVKEYFDFVSGATLDEKRAEKCEVINYVIENLKIEDKSTCVMVGDRAQDVEGAKKCGIDCIGVLYGYGSMEELQNAGADYIVKDVAELNGILCENMQSL